MSVKLDTLRSAEASPFLINNEWVVGRGASFDSVNPADGSVVATLSGASAEDVDAAVSAARHALANPCWAALKNHERARLLYKFGELVDERAEELAALQMKDNGKTISECRFQAKSAAAIFRYYAAACETWESEITTQRGPSVTMTVYEPVGVVAAITPWNSPLTLEAQKLAPILAAGNTVVLKPSEVTPHVALGYAQIAIDVGLPAGVLNVVLGAGEVGKALVDHPGVDMVSFTGGTAAGKAIAQSTGRRLIPTVLELGGKSPNIVFADADLAAAANGVAGGIFASGGQSCVAGSRVFVQRTVFDEFVSMLVDQAKSYTLGFPEADSTKIGPMTSFNHRDFVARMVENAVKEGGKVLSGGLVPTDVRLAAGAFYPATIITGITNSATVCQEEIFGPVAAVLPFDDEQDLIAQANDSAFGLASGIWTADYRKAWRVGRALRAGTVWINTYKEMSIAAPFGGFKQSGAGREKGLQGVRVYSEPKSLYWHVG